MKRQRVMYGSTLILVGVLACSSGASLAAGPDPSPGVLELAPLIREALEQNPELAVARAQMQVLRSRIPSDHGCSSKATPR